MLFQPVLTKISIGVHKVHLAHLEKEYGTNELNPQTPQWICLVVRCRYLSGGVARCGIYVRSGVFVFRSYQCHLSYITGEIVLSALCNTHL